MQMHFYSHSFTTRPCFLPPLSLFYGAIFSSSSVLKSSGRTSTFGSLPTLEAPLFIAHIQGPWTVDEVKSVVMKVTVTFGQTGVVVPCKQGWTVRDLIQQATQRYRKLLEQVLFKRWKTSPSNAVIIGCVSYTVSTARLSVNVIVAAECHAWENED